MSCGSSLAKQGEGIRGRVGRELEMTCYVNNPVDKLPGVASHVLQPIPPPPSLTSASHRCESAIVYFFSYSVFASVGHQGYDIY